jgi:N-hydroxyarylamine O-acetyltransferase
MNAPAPFDLAAYFARIGYTGSGEPSLATLNAIVVLHTAAIPFENLDVLLGRRIALDATGLQKKLIADRRGGYCFEQNGLLLLALSTLGYQVTPIGARVRWQRPRDFTPPRTHLFLQVELADGPWLADVGIGGLSLTSAIRLIEDLPQTTPHDTRRITREKERWFHQVKVSGAWADLCDFTLEAMPPIDRELANWYTSAHPESHFRNRLTLARALPDGERLTLLNDELTKRHADGSSTSLRITSPEALLPMLSEHFGLSFPAGTRFGPPGSAWPS